VSVRDFGAKGDGVTDDTAGIRAAAATGKPIWFPSTNAYYRISGYIQLQNSAYGQNRPEIRMIGSNGNPDQGNTYTIFVVNYTGSGMVIDNLHLNGGWNLVPMGNPENTPPQWAHCIRIEAPSRNVTVQNNWLERPIGDCIALTWYQPAPTPVDHIVIQNNRLTNPYRCTVALVGATNVIIRGNMHEKSDWFVTVIDLEVDPIGFQYNRNITIQDNRFNVVRQYGGVGPIHLNGGDYNGAHNPDSGWVNITGSRGMWVEGNAAVLPVVPGSGGTTTYVLGPWPGVTASDNVKDGITDWNFSS
jgi:polygalacturonase